jgi:outer membrane protein assembly factor BamD (BamD/ComL family)
MKKSVLSLLVTAVGLAIVTGCSRISDQELMEKGKKLEQQEKYANAVQTYEKIVKKYPKSPLSLEALQRTALIYTNGLQDYKTAVDVYERLIKNYPDSIKYASQAQFMIGFIYNNYAPDTAKARVAYQTFLSKYPKHELAQSVEWELKYLGKSIDEIPEIANATGEKKVTATQTSKKKKK